MTKIRVFEGVLSREECNRLIGEYSGRLTRAMFWTNGERVFDPNIRDAFNFKWDDPALTALSCDLATRLSDEVIAVERCEPMEIISYPPGNGSERHLDGPHRSHSIVCFLNEGYAGGELVFDDGTKFSGMPAGSAVVWENGPDAWHGCAPIVSGFKWVIVSWIRFADRIETEAEVHARIKREAEARAAAQETAAGD